jgi:hypothetical protein
VPVEVRIVVVPAAQIVARRRLPHHLSKRLEEAVFAQIHQHVVRVLQLCLVQSAVDGNVAVAEFRERRHDGAADGGAEEW